MSDESAPRPTLQIRAWRAVRSSGRSMLRGYAEIELPIGLRILGVPLYQDAAGVVWAELPRWPRVRDGRQLRNEMGYVWRPVLAWRDEALEARWARLVGDLVLQAYPGDFDAPGGAGGGKGA